MRPTIVESWRRTLAAGLDPTDLLAPIEAEEPEVRERWLEHPLGSVAHVLAAQLRAVAEETHSIVVVTDASGLLLHLDGADWLKDRAREMNLLEGARYSEATDGTNGIGTALAADHALQVFAFEHFNHRHHEWICSGAPVHDPVSGRIVGLIDLSSLWKIAHPRSLELVTTAAKTVERCLSDIQRDQDARLRRRYSDLMTRSTDSLVNRSGYVLDGDEPIRATPLDLPEVGGEIVLDDGSVGVAEPLGQGEAYLVRRPGTHPAKSPPIKALKRAEVRAHELASEQAALRQVATLVARESSPDHLFTVVANQVARVFDVPLVRLVRYEPDCSVVVGGFSEGNDDLFPIGSRWPLDEPGVIASVRQSGRPARVQDYHHMAGQTAAAVRRSGMRSTVASPITVEGRLWGAMEIASPRTDLPGDAELRLTDFTELVATAIANAESRVALDQLVQEQAALRRVAELVARGVGPAEVFEAVSMAVARMFGAEAGIARFEPDGSGMVLVGLSEGMRGIPIGTCWPLENVLACTEVHRTRRAARCERTGWEDASGPAAEPFGKMNPVSMVAAPIVVEGDLWGAITLADTHTSLPANAEERVEKFTELVATAIANAESRAALATSEARARDLAEEQAALRRVATLVAEGAGPATLFSAVAEEVAGLFEPAAVTLIRYDEDVSTILAASGINFPVGSRWPLDVDSLAARVHATGRPVHVRDYTEIAGAAPREMWEGHPSQSDLGVPIIVDGRLWGVFCVATPELDRNPSDTAKHIGRFTELVATAIANSEARDGLSRLLDEQAALRRVATLVAEGASSDELFATVAREAADVLDVPVVALQRFEADRMFTMVGIAGETSFAVGSRWPVEDEGLAGMILATGRPARKQDYTTMPGPLAAALRDGGLILAVGVPIVVQGSIWGFMTAGARPGKPTPDGTEERLARFTELVATAIADSQARDRLAQLAYEQSALRRVATMVASAPASEPLFSTVAREVASVLDVPGVIVTRYEPDGTAVTVGEAFGPDLAGAKRFLGVGTPMPPDPGTLTALVFDTHDPARVDDLSRSPGTVGEVARAAELGSGCAGPIVVDGAIWGKMCVFSRVGAVLPAGTEDRLQDFIELIATAIANYEARAGLAASETRARELADEQAALERVATLVAKGAKSEAVFSAVAHEVAHVFGVQHVTVCRYEPDTILVLSSFEAPEPAAAPPPFPAGRRLPLDAPSLPASVYRTGEPVRIEDFTASRGLYAVARQAGLTAAVGVPIVVDGTVWGAVNIASTKNERFLPDAEERLARFTELVATSVSNATMREELAASEARARKLAEEQASLRQVATLVAEGPAPTEVFDAVIAEVGQLLGAAQVGLARYENEHEISVLAIRGQSPEVLRAGVRLPLDGDSVNARILRTGRSARLNFAEEGNGSISEVLRRDNVNATVGAPIVVDGAVWGMIGASWRGDDQPPADAEERLAQFADLLATSVSNAAMRGELAASRARVIAAADESRRRIERDLHDGAQQQLVTLAVALQRAQAKIPSALDEVRADVGRVADGLTGAVNELRDLSRGIHPAILTEGGLSPALKALGRRSAVRVKLDVGFEHRLPDQVEVAAYYTVSETLTNASKHANATRVWVSLRLDDDMLRLSIRDGGVGGADANRGSGLTGLRDRIEALGGRIKIESPSGSGTLIEAEIPIGGPADRNDEPGELVSQATTPGPPG
jgi:GAF domain-containing protein